MAVFYATTGGDNHIMHMNDEAGLAMGGSAPNHFGLVLHPTLKSLGYNSDIGTFDLPDSLFDATEEIGVDHVEVWGLGAGPASPEEEGARVNVRQGPNLSISGTGKVDMNDLVGQIE